MIYIGIDPGLSGAVAIIRELEHPRESVYDPSSLIFDTPVLKVDNKRKPLAEAMAILLHPYQKYKDQVLVILENVHSMPKQGVTSSFNFGYGLGIWEGIIAAYELPLEKVSPQRWKKTMLADMGKTKDASRYKAISLFPEVAGQLSRVKDDGRAEALLLAEYGRRLRKGV